jgi:Uma2 family endonuclease
MSTPAAETLADLLARLGHLSPARVRLRPPPGSATEADVLEVERRENRLCELVDGSLVEKPMGFRESLTAGVLLTLLRAFVVPRNLGLVSGPDGMVRLFSGLVRIPDVAFVSWDRVPGRRVPDAPIPTLVPNLVVEVLSESNTAAEMERKLGEYFASGVELVWLFDLEARTVAVHRPAARPETLPAGAELDGGPVLRGFRLAVAEVFAELDRIA